MHGFIECGEEARSRYKNGILEFAINIVYFDQENVTNSDILNPSTRVKNYEYEINIMYHMDSPVKLDYSDDETIPPQVASLIDEMVEELTLRINKYCCNQEFNDNLYVLKDENVTGFGVRFDGVFYRDQEWIERTGENGEHNSEHFISFDMKMDVRRLLPIIFDVINTERTGYIVMEIHSEKYHHLQYFGIHSLEIINDHMYVDVEETRVNGWRTSEDSVYMLPFSSSDCDYSLSSKTTSYLYPIKEKYKSNCSIDMKYCKLAKCGSDRVDVFFGTQYDYANKSCELGYFYYMGNSRGDEEENYILYKQLDSKRV